MADEKWGTQYVVVAIGGTRERCEDADADIVKEVLDASMSLPLTTTVIRGRVADKLTVALLQEAGAL